MIVQRMKLLENFFFDIFPFRLNINKYINKIHVPYKGIIDKYFNFLFILEASYLFLKVYCNFKAYTCSNANFYAV